MLICAGTSGDGLRISIYLDRNLILQSATSAEEGETNSYGQKTRFKTENDSGGLRTFMFTVFGLTGKISLRLCGRAAGLLCGGGFSERASVKG